MGLTWALYFTHTELQQLRRLLRGASPPLEGRLGEIDAILDVMPVDEEPGYDDAEIAHDMMEQHAEYNRLTR